MRGREAMSWVKSPAARVMSIGTCVPGVNQPSLLRNFADEVRGMRAGVTVPPVAPSPESAIVT